MVPPFLLATKWFMADREHLEAALLPIITDHGLELVDLEFRAESSGWVLRLFVDKPDGVKIEDCSRLSRDCSVFLDGEELIERAYRLEVSSPGVERRLRKKEHFEKQVGQKVHIIMRRPVEGRKKATGELKEVREESVAVRCHDNVVLEIPLTEIKRANLKVF